MTFLELVKKLQRKSGAGGSTITTLADATGETLRLKDWVAEADHAIQSWVFDWKFLWQGASTIATTGIGTSDYSGPTNLGEWNRKSFKIAGTFASEVSDYDIETFPQGGSSGTPSQIFILPDNDIRVYPTPDAAYAITAEYWKAPTRLDADEDESTHNGTNSAIPSQFRDVIVYQALMYYANYENAEEARLEAQRGLDFWVPLLLASQAPNSRYGRQTDGNEIEVIAE